MNEERELGRWLDEGSDVPGELKRLLGGGRDALGTSDEVLRLQASLARALGPAASFADEPPVSGLDRVADDRAARAAQGGTSSPRLWLVGGLLAGGVAAIALFNVARWNAAEAPAPSVVSAPPRLVESPSVALPGAPSVEPALEAPPVAVEPKRAASPVARPAARPESEAALLQRAQAALATDPARALALTREHRRRFPQGSLSQEREVIAIEALKRVGAGRAAGEKASEFEQRYRGSVHKERVRSSVTAEPAAPRPSKNPAP
jgi:hypothetical protein